MIRHPRRRRRGVLFKHTGNYRGDVGAIEGLGHDAGALRGADLGAVHGLAGVRAGRRLRRPGARVLHIRSVDGAAGPGPALAGRRLGRARPAGAPAHKSTSESGTRGQRTASPRHRAEAARTLIFHAGTRACPSSGAAAYSSASSRPKRSAPAGRARPRRRPASAGPGPAARWTLRTWRTRAPGRRSRRPARTPASPWTAPRSARRSAPASCPELSLAPTSPL